MSERDQFNFTFFKERNDTKEPYISLNADAHINVSNLINSAHAIKRNDHQLLGRNVLTNGVGANA